jgi:hypothetical protein
MINVWILMVLLTRNGELVLPFPDVDTGNYTTVYLTSATCIEVADALNNGVLLSNVAVRARCVKAGLVKPT